MTETEVRALRDLVFESPTTDNNWDFCGEKWMRPDAIKWLKEQLAIMASKPTLTYESKFNA